MAEDTYDPGWRELVQQASSSLDVSLPVFAAVNPTFPYLLRRRFLSCRHAGSSSEGHGRAKCTEELAQNEVKERIRSGLTVYIRT